MKNIHQNVLLIFLMKLRTSNKDDFLLFIARYPKKRNTFSWYFRIFFAFKYSVDKLRKMHLLYLCLFILIVNNNGHSAFQKLTTIILYSKLQHSSIFK